MKMLFVIPVQFMKKNKGQTISILLGMILSIAMIAAVSSLMYSAQVNKAEGNRERYGDYHYYVWGDKKLKEDMIGNRKAGGFTFQNVQALELKAARKAENNAKLLFVYANQGCRKMIKKEHRYGKKGIGSCKIL